MASKIKYSCVGQPQKYTIASARRLPWVNGEIKWHLNNYTPDMSKHEQLMFLRDVADEFSSKMYPLKLTATENRREAYFQIHWISGDGWAHDEDGKKYFESPYQFEEGVIAVCYPMAGRPTDGLLLFNDEYFFAVKEENGKIDAKKAAMHEWAHGFGLGHTSVRKDIMSDTYNPDNEWTMDSALGLFKILGKERVKRATEDKEAMLFTSELLKTGPRSLQMKSKVDKTTLTIGGLIGLGIGILLSGLNF